MDWASIAGTLAKVGLTGLGTALGGPLGGTIGGALGGAIAAALGTDATPEAVDAAITANPDLAVAKLRDLESARHSELAAYQAQLADVQDARHMEIGLVQSGSAIAWAPVIISVLIGTIVAGVIAAVGAGRLPDNGIVVGWALGAGTTVLTYWLGSSDGSRRNGSAVREIARSAAGPAIGAAAGRAIASAVKRVR